MALGPAGWISICHGMAKYSIVAKSNGSERLGGHSWRKMWMDVL